jgi:hypothetical protein
MAAEALHRVPRQPPHVQRSPHVAAVTDPVLLNETPLSTEKTRGLSGFAEIRKLPMLSSPCRIRTVRMLKLPMCRAYTAVGTGAARVPEVVRLHAEQPVLQRDEDGAGRLAERRPSRAPVPDERERHARITVGGTTYSGSSRNSFCSS